MITVLYTWRGTRMCATFNDLFAAFAFFTCVVKLDASVWQGSTQLA